MELTIQGQRYTDEQQELYNAAAKMLLVGHGRNVGHFFKLAEKHAFDPNQKRVLFDAFQIIIDDIITCKEDSIYNTIDALELAYGKPDFQESLNKAGVFAVPPSRVLSDRYGDSLPKLIHVTDAELKIFYDPRIFMSPATMALNWGAQGKRRTRDIEHISYIPVVLKLIGQAIVSKHLTDKQRQNAWNAHSEIVVNLRSKHDWSIEHIHHKPAMPRAFS